MEEYKIHIPNELFASVNSNGSLVTVKERFKNGDVVFIQTVYKENMISLFNTCNNNGIYTHVDLFPDLDSFYHQPDYIILNDNFSKIRLATEEEKNKLFDRIKKEGYQWNSETKTLEKLYVPKNGDIVYIKELGGKEWVSIFDKIENDKLFTYCDKSSYLYTNYDFLMSTSRIEELRLATKNEKDLLFNALNEKSFVWNPDTKTVEKMFIPKDGDFIVNDDYYSISIFKKILEGDIKTYCTYYPNSSTGLSKDLYINKNNETLCDVRSFEPRLATETEKQTLLDELNSKGLYWNSEAKELYEICIPKNGDVIFVGCEGTYYKDCNIAIYNYSGTCGLGTFLHCYCALDVDDNKFYYHSNINFNIIRPIRLATEEEKQKLFNAINKNNLYWDFENKKLKPLVKLIDANRGDFVFIRTQSHNYICVFNRKDADKIWTSCYEISSFESYYYTKFWEHCIPYDEEIYKRMIDFK